MAHEKLPEAGPDQLAALSEVAEALRVRGALALHRAGQSTRMTGGVRSTTKTWKTVEAELPERSRAVSLTLTSSGVENTNTGASPRRTIGEGSPATRNS